jgi:hypothetical protein
VSRNELRQAIAQLIADADQLHALYRAYLDAGFSEYQAMQLVCAVISAGIADD